MNDTRTGEGRVLLVGQAPSRASDPAVPLGGRSGRRLAGLAGLGYEEYLEHFERMNALDYYPGPAAVGDLFSLAKAQRELLRKLPRQPQRVLFVGKSVARAMGLGDLDYFDERMVLYMGGPCEDWEGGTKGKRAVWAVFPHPSGVSRWWNEPGNAARAGRFLREFSGLPLEGD